MQCLYFIYSSRENEHVEPGNAIGCRPTTRRHRQHQRAAIDGGPSRRDRDRDGPRIGIVLPQDPFDLFAKSSVPKNALPLLRCRTNGAMQGNPPVRREFWGMANHPAATLLPSVRSSTSVRATLPMVA
jgi:hypothetical protein